MLRPGYNQLLIGGLLLVMLTMSSRLTFAQTPPQPPAPADFVAVIDNPYFPLIPGTTLIYEGLTEDGLEYVEINVLTEPRQVMGITATVVKDTVYAEDEMVEQTFDWFAQDKAGNVWYLGETVDNYEDGQLLDHAGSWEAGVNDALPGIIMYANPAAHIGETYYQEYYPGEAEDQAKLLSASENVTIAYGTYTDVVKTYDFSTLDPDAQEEKYYAAGIGTIKTVDLKTGETFALIEFHPAAPPAVPAKATPTPAASPTPVPACGTENGLGCAPASARVDRARPSFSNSTTITNPLFPISQLHSAVLLGNIDGRMFRAETTLLPGTKTITLNGQMVNALTSQYTAYLDGRIQEVALDWYAQANDGSVWYLGEDVFNYEDGALADTEGTWLAGRDGPAAMIMPANPQTGDVYRSENSPGLVFEEVTVKSVDETEDGPAGVVTGAIVTQELHMDGSHEAKIFAPGYGEFYTGNGGDLEALALAVPTDALTDPAPVELETMFNGAMIIFDAAESGNWETVSASFDTIAAAWVSYRLNGTVPQLLDAQMNRALVTLAGDALAPAVKHHNAAGTRKAAIDVAQASLDLQLRYQPVTEIDRARFGLWVQQVLVDAAGGEAGLVLGDVTALEWIWDRFAHTLASADASVIETRLDQLRAAADEEDLPAAAAITAQLQEALKPE